MSELKSMLAINTQTEYEHYKQGSRDGYARGLRDALAAVREENSAENDEPVPLEAGILAIERLLEQAVGGTDEQG